MKSDANFLLTGDAYAFDLPDELDPEAELRSVLAYDGAVRYVAYQPFGHEPEPRENGNLAYGFSVRRGGRLVAVYRALDEPSTRVAYWKLAKGHVSTFFDDRLACDGQAIDTDEGIREIVSGITVSGGVRGLPALQLRGPVFGGNIGDPFQREAILFHAREQANGAMPSWLSVEVWNEPAFVRRGTGRWDEPELAGRSVTNELSITVEVKGSPKRAADLERYAERIAASAVPLN
jgi:hypothetical protein